MIRVLKIGGRAQQDELLHRSVAAAWRAAPSLVLIHGGGDEVSDLQRQLGREPRFVNGRRVTNDEDIALLRMTLSGVVNKRLVAALVANGAPAIGLSGEDASLLSAAPIDVATMGRSGFPLSVNTSVITHLLAAGLLPVISPVARDASRTGDALNVNGDDAAAFIAGAMGAEELLFVADVPGVLEQGRVLPGLDEHHMRRLANDGAVTSGMLAKLEAAAAARAAGVATVRIGDANAITDSTAGTALIGSFSVQALSPVAV